MIQLLFPLLIGIGVFLYLLKSSETKASRWTGSIIILLATVCFLFYSYGILGVGLSSWILDLFGKAGVIL